MKKFLPIAWIVFVPIAATIWVGSSAPLFSQFAVSTLLPRLFNFVPSALLFGAFAIVYAIFRRTVTSITPFVLGWAHLSCEGLSNMSEGYYWYVTQQAFAQGGSADREFITTWASLAGGFGVLANLLFFIAVLTAFQNTRQRIAIQTFD